MKVSVIVVADRPTRLPVLLWSLAVQTHRDLEVIVLDQSATGDVDKYWIGGDVLQVRWDWTARRGDWGYAEKARAARELATGDALLFPQDDSYYTPTAVQRLSEELERGHDLALCGWLYDQFGYCPMPPAPHVGHVDIGGFIVRRETFLAHGWPDGDPQTTDGRFIERLVASGVRTGLCRDTLYVRN